MGQVALSCVGRPPYGKLASIVDARCAADTAGMTSTGNAQRTLYLVCYDVSCPKRLYRVHRYLLGFKVGGQKSFFECWFTPAELRAARGELAVLIDPVEDRVHIFQLDPRMKMEGLGIAVTPAPTSSAFMVL